jgi:cation:H+ antiporter
MDASLNFLLENIFLGSIPPWAFLIAWFAILAVALFALIRGADTFVEGARHIGSDVGMSKFAIGVFIVGFGTSLPELASSIAAALEGEPTIVIANVVGSNINNILLIVGILAAFGGRIIVKRDLIKAELPVFFIATTLFILVVYDGLIDRHEALLLLGTFATYLWYLFFEAAAEDKVELTNHHLHHHMKVRSLAFMVLGTVGVLVGAHYTISMMVNIAGALAVPLGLVAILAISLGSSLPELFVSLQAIKKGEQELAIGNIYGAFTFNILVVIGIPALIMPLPADVVSMQLGIGVLAAAAVIFFICGLAKQILRWEGMMMLLVYAFFLSQLLEFA